MLDRVGIRVAVINLKGGTAKTTTAVCLAEAAGEAGAKCVVIDADPQAGGTATDWADLASADGTPLRTRVIAAPTITLADHLPKRTAADLVIIDPPQPTHPRILRAVIAAADIALIPVPPRVLDLRRLNITLDLVRNLRRPAVIVLTQTSGDHAIDAARTALEDANVTVLDTTIPTLRTIAAAAGTRPNNSQVLDHHHALHAELNNHTPKRGTRRRG